MTGRSDAAFWGIILSCGWLSACWVIELAAALWRQRAWYLHYPKDFVMNFMTIIRY
jgi:hypothetical protein